MFIVTKREKKEKQKMGNGDKEKFLFSSKNMVK